MNDVLQQGFQGDPLQSFITLLLAFVLYVLLGLLPAIAVLYLTYLFLTLPLRRNERARLFLDLLELGLRSGRSAENSITDAATSKDRELGVKYQLLATYLRQGIPLGEALELVPRLLPPQVRAMLKTGIRLGDLKKVLPACRLSLRGGLSEVRGALNYVVILSFLATPFAVAIPLILKVKVIPAFKAIFEGMLEGSSLPAFTRFILGSSSYLVAIQASLFVLIWLLTLCYLGGPRLRAWLGRFLPGGERLIDRVLFWLPWRRKRLQRDFCSILAVLLESGVPELEAIRFAGESTANTLFRRRAERAGSLLSQGVKLPDAIRVLDESGELQWRLTNALHGKGGFVKALSGWLEALDNQAFQLEQTAAQITTTAFVLINGLIIGCIVIGLFLPLILLMNRATLW